MRPQRLVQEAREDFACVAVVQRGRFAVGLRPGWQLGPRQVPRPPRSPQAAPRSGSRSSRSPRQPRNLVGHHESPANVFIHGVGARLADPGRPVAGDCRDVLPARGRIIARQARELVEEPARAEHLDQRLHFARRGVQRRDHQVEPLGRQRDETLARMPAPPVRRRHRRRRDRPLSRRRPAGGRRPSSGNRAPAWRRPRRRPARDRAPCAPQRLAPCSPAASRA